LMGVVKKRQGKRKLCLATILHPSGNHYPFDWKGNKCSVNCCSGNA
jgi:hypothetical protein